MYANLNMLFVAILIAAVNDIAGVIHGQPVEIEDFPFSASLSHVTHGHKCGGAIIGERYVLTAGHCVHDVLEWDYVIKVGIVDLRDGSTKPYMINEFHLHPDYVPEKGQSESKCERIADEPVKHDIAVVETCDKFGTDLPSLSSLRQPASSPNEPPAKRQRLDNTLAKIEVATYFPGQCAICTFSGWGCLDKQSYDPDSQRLLYRPMAIHSPEDCERENCRRQSDLFCAQHPSRKTSCAERDSGGPLVCNGVLVGVLSTVGNGEDSPGGFVDVSQYQSFIVSILDKPKLKVNSEL